MTNKKIQQTPQELDLISWVISHWWIVFDNITDFEFFLYVILDPNNFFENSCIHYLREITVNCPL